jgi:hypothetical protein
MASVPIEYLVVAFPDGNISDEIAPELADLVDRKVMAGTGASRATWRDVPCRIPSRCRPGGSCNPSPAGAAGVPAPAGPRSS